MRSPDDSDEGTDVIAGRYEPRREIGRGGMGSVWLARDTALGRDVAVKRIGMLPGSSEADIARAEREARLAAMLTHPHVVAIFDLVEDGEDQWLVMEYVEGTTVASMVHDAALPEDQAGSLLGQVAGALAAAHEAGVVHRDVKPSNILVTGDGTAKLADFGIARSEADPSLTRTSQVTGSPAYLAPEVASGRVATEAGDVWSLGATLFHAVAGRPPYEVQDNVLGAMYRIVHEPPPRLPDAGWVAPVLEGTMTKDPTQRWSMSEVRDFFESHGAVAPPPPPGTAARATQDVARTGPATPAGPAALAPTPPHRRRRRRLSPAAVLAAVFAVALAGVLGWQWLGDDDSDSPTNGATPVSASEPRETKSPDPEPDAQGMERFIDDYLTTVTDQPRMAFEMLTPGFQQASGNFGGYQGFWDGIDSAEVNSIQADPATLTVRYDVDYVRTNGETWSDEVRLKLEFRDGSYRIAGEA